MRKTRGAVSSILLGILFIIAGIFAVIFPIVSPDSKLVPANSDAAASSSSVYDFGQVLVLDKYGYIENSRGADEDYYLVAYFNDEDDYAYLASLKVTDDTDIYDKLDEYSNDDTAYIGDLYINLCAKSDSIASIEPEMAGYYNDAIELYGQYYTGTVDTRTALSFYCEGAEAFGPALEAENRSKTLVSVIGAVIAALGILFLATGIVRKKKEKKIQAAMPQQDVYYTPQSSQDVYYDPQASGPGSTGQWTNGEQDQTPQSPSEQPSSSSAADRDNLSNSYQDPYCTSPADNDSDHTETPENGGHNSQ